VSFARDAASLPKSWTAAVG